MNRNPIAIGAQLIYCFLYISEIKDTQSTIWYKSVLPGCFRNLERHRVRQGIRGEAMSFSS